MRTFLMLFVVVMTLLVTGCSSAISNLKPFRLEIQQGNVVTSKMLLQLRPGMTKSQVRYIMGTPLLVDSFHGNRWDYIFQLRQSGKITEQKRVVLEFENETLKTVHGDVMPTAEAGVVKLTPAAEVTAPKVKNAKDDTGESFTDKLKFWKKEDKPAVDAVKAGDTDVKSEPASATSVAVPVLAGIALAEPVVAEQVVLQPIPAPPSIGPATDAAIESAPQDIPSAAVVSPEAVVPVTESASQRPNTGTLSEYELKFDRTLDLTKGSATKEPVKSFAPQATKAGKAVEGDGQPGYFERMLEKVGF